MRVRERESGEKISTSATDWPLVVLLFVYWLSLFLLLLRSVRSSRLYVTWLHVCTPHSTQSSSFAPLLVPFVFNWLSFLFKSRSFRNLSFLVHRHHFDWSLNQNDRLINVRRWEESWAADLSSLSSCLVQFHTHTCICFSLSLPPSFFNLKRRVHWLFLTHACTQTFSNHFFLHCRHFPLIGSAGLHHDVHLLPHLLILFPSLYTHTHAPQLVWSFHKCLNLIHLLYIYKILILYSEHMHTHTRSGTCWHVPFFASLFFGHDLISFFFFLDHFLRSLSPPFKVNHERPISSQFFSVYFRPEWFRHGLVFSFSQWTANAGHFRNPAQSCLSSQILAKSQKPTVSKSTTQSTTAAATSSAAAATTAAKSSPSSATTEAKTTATVAQSTFKCRLSFVNAATAK